MKDMAGYRVMFVLISVFILGVILIGYAMNATAETVIWLSALPFLAIPLINAAIVNWNRFMDD